MENFNQIDLRQLEPLQEKLGLLSRTNQKIRNLMKAKRLPKQEFEEMKERVLELEFWIEKCKLNSKEDTDLFTNLQLLKEKNEKSNLRLQRILKEPFPSQLAPQTVDEGAIGKPISFDAEKRLQKKVVNQIPAIVPLSMQEFSAVPHYMKGRLTVEKINQFVTEFNKTVAAKYKILQTPRNQLSDAQMRKFRIFNSQKCDESYDLHFCTDEDLKEFSNLKIDNAARSTLVILRHCGRIKHVRNGSVVLHAILPALVF